MTVMQWIILINLGIKLYKEYKESKEPEENKAVEMMVSIEIAKDSLSKKTVGHMDDVLGKKSENVPMLIELITNVFSFLEKK